WDVATGAALKILKGHSNSVNSVAFSPDSKQVASGSGDYTVRLWDTATGAALQTLKGYYYSVYSVAFSPNGKQVISGFPEKTVQRWDATTGVALQALHNHSSSVSSVAFLPDGQLIPTLHVFNNWLVEGTTNLLWLPTDYRPTDYRPTCEAVLNKLLVLGHSSGRISFLQIKQRSELSMSN
ncbi:hypothetical protein O988_01010, partial [Pseudogymnoascus sp. VKM F-3808]